jgi:hypothetical protein
MGTNSVPTSDAENHFKSLLEYFKHLVWLTSAAVGIIVAVASYFLFSNLRDVRKEAKEEATRVATDEAKLAVKNAFDEKNINDLILRAAKDKVGTVTDKMIEEQLTTNLRPVEDRILLIGHISECEARIHTGFRSALIELTGIVNTARDPTALRFAKSTLEITTDGYNTYWLSSMKEAKAEGIKPLDFLSLHLPIQGRPQTPTLHDAIVLIDTNQDLNVVALAFIVFREITGENVKMFDFASVKAWCAKHQTECQ